jgi:hypothetical protein
VREILSFFFVIFISHLSGSVSFYSEKQQKIFWISGLTCNSMRTFAELTSKTFASLVVPSKMIGLIIGTMLEGGVQFMVLL